MKKFLALLLSLVMVMALVACGAKEEPAPAPDPAPEAGTTEPAPAPEANPAEDYKIAMITDYGDITDQSFNQTTYEACKAFADANGVDFNYFKPAGDNTADRVAMIEKAVDEGYNVIVMPGYAFAGAIVEAAPQFPEAMFIALDVAEGDLLEAGVTAAGEAYDYNPANWDFAKYVDMSNVYSAIYQEELCGYMAGYATVKLGYKDLGYCGGMAVPAVIRFGNGFIQGAEAAAAELGLTDVTLKHAYANQFFGDADITAAMDSWYQNGTELVFACGGGVFTSVAEAAVKVDGKLVGVDVDQAKVIDPAYGEGLTVTSAMKGLYPTTYDTLSDVILNGNWSKYAGKIETLGLVSGTDPEANYVQIPMESTQWSDAFTQDDYKALVAGMFDGSIKVDNDITKTPSDLVSAMKVEELGNLK